ncbi:dihydrofolate reductase family protein [Glaciihabitans sp. GrIS 2.15]|uniref:dihydrofolate reductase family protein n=1 Tax=Glaciihabitans sp. GrIS 2.15 TaxID=3071710 RepID=UPI002E0E372A
MLRGGNHLTQEIEELAARDGLDFVLTGSISLSHNLFRANLVDEVRLFVNPLVLDDGRRMFPQGWNVAELGLVEERRFSGGVVLRRYLLRH